MKTKRFQIKNIGEGLVRAVIATLNVKDHDGDVTVPGAFGEQEVPIVPTHNWGSVPLGKAKISETDDEVVAEMKFNLDTTPGRDWFSALKFDFENGTPKQEYSYGYDIVESDRGAQDGENVQFLKKLKAIEVSPVILGAGLNTRTLAVKSGALSQSVEDQFQTAETALVSVSGFKDRVKALATLRAEEGKEGRVLSQANRDRLSRLRTLIGDIQTDIDKLLSESEPPKDDDEKAAAVDNTIISLVERRTAYQRAILGA